MTTTHQTSRFNVGQVYYFCQVSFSSLGIAKYQTCTDTLDTTPIDDTDAIFSPMYRPWVDTLNSISIVALTCIEEHAVTDGYSYEHNYTGFVFECKEDGTIWHNQYPNASYGQLDEAANWTVRPVHNKLEIDAMSTTDVESYFSGFKLMTTVIQQQAQALNPCSRLQYVGRMDNSQIIMPAITKYIVHLIELLTKFSHQEVTVTPMVHDRKIIHSVINVYIHNA